MIKLLVIVLIIVLAMVLAPHFMGHQGYVIIQTQDYRITTSIAIALVCLIIITALLVLVFGLLNKARHTGLHTHQWLSSRHQRKAIKQNEQALNHWFSGDYQRAEQLAARSAQQSPTPLLSYLLAAQSAAKNQHVQQAYHYLEQAGAQQKGFSLPLEVVRTQLQLTQHDNQAAEQNVTRLLEYAPYHPQVLRLAEQAYHGTGNYAALLNLLPLMKKKQIYTEEQLQQKEKKTYLGIMEQQVAKYGAQGLLQWWKECPRKIRQQIDLQVALIYHLFKQGDDDNAQQMALNTLKQDYDKRLIQLLPQLATGAPEKLHRCLAHLIEQEPRPELYRAQGLLFMKQGDWQIALENFQQAIKQQPLAEDYLQLAQIYEHLQQSTQANDMRQKALALSLKGPEPLLQGSLPHF